MIQYNISMFGRGRSRHSFGAATSWRRQAFTLVAFVAVFLQAFVVQTHIHVPLAPVVAAVTGQSDDGSAPAAHASVSNHHQLMCEFCQALAAGGVATLTTGAILHTAYRTNAATNIALALAPSSLSHSWQSRAPPSFL